MADPIFVDLDGPGGKTVPVGQAHVTMRRGSVATTFLYQADYLQRPGAYAIEPGLPLTAGPHHVVGLPGAFADAAPDRWGRTLIVKRLRGADDGAGWRTPTEVDYLLGVSDVTRQGALRFRSAPQGPHLSPHAEVPPLVTLPRLLRASDRIAAGGAELSAVKELLEAGTGSLGGARPKASVRDGATLLIAKFPHPHDDWDVMRWEATALDLAYAAGVEVPEHRLVTVDGRGVLLLRRFDRSAEHRIGYISAMTLVGATDGEVHDYAEIVEALAETGGDVAVDLADLWRRLLFSVAIRNTDDHLRNHGFLRRDRGWRLAPAFDINPNPAIDAPRVTGIAGAWTPAEEVDGLLLLAPECGIGDAQARLIAGEVLDAVDRWRQIAAQNGVISSEAAHFAPVFEGARRRLARLLAT